ncbi:MAG TPA: lysophospholipid transporter LplT [Burkholderiaceae bacterium]|nr:lysophospholipid transporter LplT [Burkholderiaceae bacterium]
MPRGFYRLIAAQFFSALADNALLIVAIALLAERGLAGWWAPLLKFSLVAFYVLLAPALGPLADAFPKARLMAATNALKVAGVGAMLAGMHPVGAFAIIGFAAAAYAPAKYGLVTEMVATRSLVAANSWIEVTAVGAVLLGALVGGFLVSDTVRAAAASLRAALGAGAGSGLVLSLALVSSIYALAALLNVGIASPRASYGRSPRAPLALARDFLRANVTLWRDRAGGLSLAVTTLFWGTGATLQFAVLRWAVDVLGLPLHKAAYLQAIAAVGLVVGATAAGRFIGIHAAPRVLPAGVLLGALALLVPLIESVALAAPLLVLVGIVSGVFVVPMNALLQHRGYEVLTPGRSIAVQGFNENLSVLTMLAAYAALLKIEVPITTVMFALGVMLIITMGALVARERGTRTGRPETARARS